MKKTIIVIALNMLSCSPGLVYAGQATDAIDSLKELALEAEGTGTITGTIPDSPVTPCRVPDSQVSENGAPGRTPTRLAGLVARFLQADEALRIDLLISINKVRSAESDAFLKAVSDLELETPAVRAAARSGSLSPERAENVPVNRAVRPHEKMEILKRFLRTVTRIISLPDQTGLYTTYTATLGIRG